MKKRVALIVLIAFCSAILGGCWNYRGLDKMTIATGVGIDRDPISGMYHLSFEYVDLSHPVKEQGIVAGLIESYGNTLFDAARNAKKRATYKLYFAHVELLLLNEDVARNTDISDIIDFFLRDAEFRETMCVAVAQSATAKDILSLDGLGQPILAYVMHHIIEEDSKVTSSTVFQPLYKIYNILHSEGIELTLPVVHSVPNADTTTCELNGVAVFKGERMVGHLTPEESKYFLFATDQIRGGLITCSTNGEGPDDTSLEIHESHTKTSFRYRDGQLTMQIKVEVKVFLDDTGAEIDVLEPSDMERVEASASRKVLLGITDVIQRVKTDYGSDIFGFGNIIYQRNNKLWQQLKDRWDDVFANMPVEVSCDVKITNTAYFKKK